MLGRSVQNGGGDAKRRALECVANVVLPHSQRSPAGLPQCPTYTPISAPIAGDLLLPECSVRLWPCPVYRTTMPEAAVNKDGNFRLSEDKVGRAR